MEAHALNIVDAGTTAWLAALVMAVDAAETSGANVTSQVSGRVMAGKVISFNAERGRCSISVINSNGGSTPFDCVLLDSVYLLARGVRRRTVPRRACGA